MDIKEALGKLDPANDQHWTADGLPLLDAVKMIASNPGINREAVTAAAPGFNRAVASAVPPTGPAAGAQAPSAAQRDPALGTGANGAHSAPQAPNVEEQIKALQKKLDEARGEIELKKADYSKIEKDLDALLILQARTESTPQKTQHAIQGYLEAQKQEREARAARLALVKETGVDIKALAQGLVAPIDASRQRHARR